MLPREAAGVRSEAVADAVDGDVVRSPQCSVELLQDKVHGLGDVPASGFPQLNKTGSV